MTTFELAWDSRCGVAESPVWDASTRRLLFCDIPGRRINALSVDDGARASWDFPDVVGSFGLCLSGRLLSRNAITSCCSIRAPGRSRT